MLHKMKRGLFVASAVAVVAALCSGSALAARGHTKFAPRAAHGMMGGFGAHEYMAPCAAGENDVALAPGYAANVEIARADPQPVELPLGLDAPEEVSTRSGAGSGAGSSTG